MDLKWTLLAFVLFSNLGWSQTALVDGANLTRVWRCQAKYSGRVVTIREKLSDFNPLIYIEADGQSRFLGNDNSFEGSLFERSYNTHLCFTDSRQNLYYFQMMESLYLPSKTSKVMAELQRYPNYSGPDSCKNLEKAGGFDQSDYMECEAFPHQITNDGYSGPYSMASSKTDSNLDGLGNAANVRRLRVAKDGRVFTLIRERANSSLKVSNGSSTGSYFSDKQTTEKLQAILGLAGVLQSIEFEDLALDSQDRVVLAASINIKRKENWLTLPVLVRLTSDGQLDSSYGVKGVARLLKDFVSDEYSLQPPRIHALGNGRIVAIHADPWDKHPTGGRVTVMDADGTRNAAFKKNLESNPEWKDIHADVNRNLRFFNVSNERFTFGFRNSTDSTSYNYEMGVEGVEDRGFFKEIYDAGCTPLDVAPSVTKRWNFSVYCENTKSYGLIRVDAKGVIDRGYGVNGVAAFPKFKDVTMDDGSDFVETQDGSLLISNYWKGVMTGSYVSGLVKLTPQGVVDQTYGQMGLYSGGPTVGSVANSMRLARASGGVVGVTLVWSDGKYLLLERRYTP